MKRRSIRLRVARGLVSLVLLGTAAGGVVVWHRKAADPGSGSGGGTRDRFATVTGGDFNIVLDLEGNLDAIRRHMIRPDNRAGRFGLEIVEMVENHKAVKTGDMLFRFSEEKHKVERDRLLLALADEQTSLRLAEEDLDMTRAGNLSSIRAACDQLRAANEALSRYEEEDALRKRQDLQTAIRSARAKYAQLDNDLSAARSNLSEAQMQNSDRVPELEKLVGDKTLAMNAARDEVAKSLANLRVFKQYDHPQKMRTLQEGRTKAQMAMQRDLVTAAGNLVKDQRVIQNHRTRIRQLEEELAQLEVIRKSLVLTAPTDGIVTLGDPQPRRWNQPEEFKVGGTVSPGQTIASIPDLSRFLVRINLPEEFRSRVDMGMRAVLKSKALPDLVMEGKISRIAAMAQNVVYWDQSSPKIYPIEITTETVDQRLMPGMTIQVEIVVEEIKGVLHLPIEAVYQREGKTYVRVNGITLDERQVTTGRASNSYVEILSGVEEGDRVALSRPGLTE